MSQSTSISSRNGIGKIAPIFSYQRQLNISHYGEEFLIQARAIEWEGFVEISSFEDDCFP